MSTRNLPWEVKVAGAKGWQLYYLHFLAASKFWEPQPSGSFGTYIDLYRDSFSFYLQIPQQGSRILPSIRRTECSLKVTAKSQYDLGLRVHQTHELHPRVPLALHEPYLRYCSTFVSNFFTDVLKTETTTFLQRRLYYRSINGELLKPTTKYSQCHN